MTLEVLEELTETDPGVDQGDVDQEVVDDHGEEGGDDVDQGHVEDDRRVWIARLEIIHSHNEASRKNNILGPI